MKLVTQLTLICVFNRAVHDSSSPFYRIIKYISYYG